MNELTELISIIIPIYNMEKYLPKCLESVLAQSYKNLEIICVDDGSSDSSAQIINKYALSDSRIKLVSQSNSGLSPTRNKGMSVATGSRIMFIDSDDWIDIDTCETALNVAVKYDADVVLWNYTREFANKSLDRVIFSDEQIIFDSDEALQRLHHRFVGLVREELNAPENADSIVTAWGKLYKAETLLNSGVKFVDTKIIGSAEDALFNLELFNFVKKVVYINKFFYHYRKDNVSSLTRKYNPELFNRLQNLYAYMDKCITENSLGEDFSQALSNRIALGMIGIGLNETANPAGTLTQIKNLKGFLRTPKYRSVLGNLTFKYFPLHWKLFFLCCKWRFGLGLFLLLKVMQKITGR